MSERFCGVAFVGLENEAVDAFDCLDVEDLLILFQIETKFCIAAHGDDVKKYENVAKSLSRAVETTAVVRSCSSSGYSAYHLFHHGRTIDEATFEAIDDDSQIYRDIGISSRELANLFLAYKVPRSVNPLGLLAAVQRIRNNGWQGSQLIPHITRQAELAERLIEQSNYASASKLLKEVESQLKTQGHDRHTMFLRYVFAFHQSAVGSLS